MDRHRDFRRVFLDSEQGKRVLYEVLAWSGMFRPSAQGNYDTNETFFHEGQRDVALKIMFTVSTEPKARPQSSKE